MSTGIQVSRLHFGLCGKVLGEDDVKAEDELGKRMLSGMHVCAHVALSEPGPAEFRVRTEGEPPLLSYEWSTSALAIQQPQVMPQRSHAYSTLY